MSSAGPRRRQRGVVGRGGRASSRVSRASSINLRGRHAFAEEETRGLRQLVRLVEDDRVAGGQQLGDALVAQHQIGEEQVMVDDHHVRGERLPRASMTKHAS